MIVLGRCKTCRFMGEVKANGDGTCRVNPPILLDDGSEYGKWPIVSPNEDWCGQHVAKFIDVNLRGNKDA